MHKLKQLAAAAMVAAAFVVLFAAAAFAQATGAPTLDAGNIWNQVLPGIADTVVAIVGLVAIYLANLLRKRTGIDIEDKIRAIEANHRDALHQAIWTALGSAAAKFGIDKLTFTPNSEVGRFIVGVVNASVPEAVKVLGAGEQWILRAAEAKLALTPDIAAKTVAAKQP